MSDPTPIKRLRHLLTYENLWLYILSILKKRSEYAYALDSQIEQEFSFKPNKIMIYVVLYKLESEGLIKSEFIARRKYYAPTQKGLETLEFAKNHLSSIIEKI